MHSKYLEQFWVHNKSLIHICQVNEKEDSIDDERASLPVNSYIPWSMIILSMSLSTLTLFFLITWNISWDPKENKPKN